jgi:succinate dehydrogenase/fumarate reductase flavoprotein subunit
MSGISEGGSRISRRAFLRAAGVGVALGGASQVAPLAAARAFAAPGPDLELDVAVVGSGVAAWPAAILAREAGAEVAIFEKGAFAGGTTLKSGGVYWVPNNPVMRAQGIEDPRQDALRYMARLAYPDQYSPGRAQLGIEPARHALLETFYDRGSAVIERLARLGVLASTFWPTWDGHPFPDYHAELPENRAPRGRAIVPRRADGSAGAGADLITAFRAAVQKRGIPVHLRHAASRLVTNARGDVAGLEVVTPQGPRRVRARRGVVFASGGFSHNPALVRDCLRGIAYGSCEVPTNEGDFVALAAGIGARLANMRHAAWKQVVLERVLDFGSIPNGVAVIPGDSSLVVNREGLRVVNEKLNYNQRGQVHFDWDASGNLYRNQLLFMIYDGRTAELFAGMEPIPAKGALAPEVLRADTLDALAREIAARLEALAARAVRFTLAPGFADQLKRSTTRFGELAKRGVDADFQRGQTQHELAFHGPRRPGNDLPNPLMHPLAETGPYFAIILAAGTYGTRGGPEIDSNAQVVRADGTPIRGLYGAGNCVASPAGAGYFGGGSQLGPGIVFGAIAGEHAASQGVIEA